MGFNYNLTKQMNTVFGIILTILTLSKEQWARGEVIGLTIEVVGSNPCRSHILDVMKVH